MTTIRSSRVALAGALMLVACPNKEGPETDSVSAADASTSTSTATADSTSTSTGTGGSTVTDPTASSAASATFEPTTGEDPSASECKADSDCVLVANCCECDARPADEAVTCDQRCLVDVCTAESTTGLEVACRSGRCELAEVHCFLETTCDAPKPSCSAGKLPTTENGCWGPCAPAHVCVDNDCDSCPEGWTCVGYDGGLAHCVPTPKTCGDPVTCSCFGSYFGEVCLTSCEDDVEGHPVYCPDGA